MRQNNLWQMARSDYSKLLLIVALAFYIGFIPHQGYLFPVHIDEWFHMAQSDAIMAAGNTTYPGPFYEGSSYSLGTNLEIGFHVFLGVFQRISGISWPDIFRYFPSIIFVMTVLAVYVLGRRQGFGWEAAFFTCLIPTTVGIMGPAFLVPLAMGLFFIAMSIFVAFNFRTWGSYLVLFIFIVFLLAIHAPTAVGLILILIPYILLNLTTDFKHSLGMSLALALPFLILFPVVYKILSPYLAMLFTPRLIPIYIDIPLIIRDYGYLPVGFCLLGVLLLAIKGGKENYGLILGLLALLAMTVTFYTFHYGFHILYTRGLVYMMLMLSVLAGAGLKGIRTISLPGGLFSSDNSLWARSVGPVLCLALIVAMLVITIPDRQDTPYYYMIDEQDYNAFVWVRDNVGEDYVKAVLDPWKGTPFSAVTGKKIYSKIHEAPKATDAKAQEFINNGCTDTAFLRDNGISIVYSNKSCSNPDLLEVRENVYLLLD